MPSYFAFAATSAALFGVSLAGLQVPLVIVNFSPHEASVDMSLDENCIKHDFNPVDLGHYYDSWESNNLGNFDKDYAPFNDYLQQYKTMFGLPKLRDNKAPMSGITAIPALTFNESYVPTTAPYMVFETEMDGSGGCFGSHSRKSFNITVDGKTQSFTLEDPPKSEWTLTKTQPENTQIVLGPGGHAKWGLVTVEVITLAAVAVAAEAFYSTGQWLNSAGFFSNILTELIGPVALRVGLPAIGSNGILGVLDYLVKHHDEKSMEDSAQGAVQNFDPKSLTQSFTSIYDTINVDDRRACILGLNVIGNYDCLVAGVSLIIQPDGNAMAVPLPDIYRAWN